MNHWWDGLTILQKTFFLCAVPSTLILTIQLIFSLIGFGFDGNADADVDPDFDDIDDIDDIDDADASTVRFFTIKGITAFFSIGGWTGYVLAGAGVNVALTIIAALAAGLLALYAIGKMVQAAMRLQSNGIIDIRNALGSMAEVYIPIPAGNKGTGKVSVVIQGRLTEYNAITYGQKTLKTGTVVKVVDVIEPDILVVEQESNN